VLESASQVKSFAISHVTSLLNESSGAARSCSRMARVRSRHMLRCKAVLSLISFICVRAFSQSLGLF
jgi:hypothetical protein